MNIRIPNFASIIAFLGVMGGAFSTVQVSSAETNSSTGNWAYLVGLAVALFTAFLTSKQTGKSDADALVEALKQLVDKHQPPVVEVKVPEPPKIPQVPDRVIQDVVSTGTGILDEIADVIATYNKKARP